MLNILIFIIFQQSGELPHIQLLLLILLFKKTGTKKKVSIPLLIRKITNQLSVELKSIMYQKF